MSPAAARHSSRLVSCEPSRRCRIPPCAVQHQRAAPSPQSNRLPLTASQLYIISQIKVTNLSLQMLEHSPRTLPRLAVRLGIISVVMGTSLHLVAESVTRRLLLIGYQLHLPVRNNTVMKELEPSSLVGSQQIWSIF